MEKLSNQQKRYLIDLAKECYLLAFKIRVAEGDPYIPVKNENQYLTDSCYNISSLIYYIANEKFKIPDDMNEVYDCLFTDGSFQTQHFVNRIYGDFIDASIEQFNFRLSEPKYSPYNDNSAYYFNPKRVNPMNAKAIQYEMDAYGQKDYVELLKNHKGENQKWQKRFLQRIFGRNRQ
jgi:hypothetical protein